MKQVIWKFPLSTSETATGLELPRGAQVLHIDVQHGKPCLWALVDPAEPLERRVFAVVMTGQEFDSEGYRFINTLLVSGGSGVLHYFEVLP